VTESQCRENKADGRHRPLEPTQVSRNDLITALFLIITTTYVHYILSRRLGDGSGPDEPASQSG